jgi:UDP-N-acetylmuramyl pentapeptide phosphotransferase/UDP-N-acetylglucosamine-1-phosphate transferase
MLKTLGAQRLLALFAAGWLAFNFPLQRLWSGDPLSLFLAWGALIGVLALLMERAED